MLVMEHLHQEPRAEVMITTFVIYLDYMMKTIQYFNKAIILLYCCIIIFITNITNGVS